MKKDTEKTLKNIKLFLNKKKNASNNMVVKDTKIYQNVHIEKALQNEKKQVIIIIIFYL